MVDTTTDPFDATADVSGREILVDTEDDIGYGETMNDTNESKVSVTRTDRCTWYETANADEGPIVRCLTISLKTGEYEPERWVVSTLLVLDSGMMIPYGVRLRHDGEPDLRHCARDGFGGIHTRPLPAQPWHRHCTGEYRRPAEGWQRTREWR